MVQYRGIGQIAFTVSNLAATTAFYRDRVGLRLLFEVPGMAFFDGGGVRLMFGQAGGTEPAAGGGKAQGGAPGTIFYLRVDDIEAAHRHLQDQDIRCEHEPRLVHRAEDHDLWLSFYRDCEDNVFALMSEAPKS